MATTTNKDTAFSWPTPAKKLLSAYLKERTSGEPDAPHQGLPFITDKGVLRVRPSDWIEWLDTQGIAAPKRQAIQVLKDADLIQRVYPLPAHEAHPDLRGKSFGLYTGPAPTGTARLPRRVPQRP